MSSLSRAALLPAPALTATVNVNDQTQVDITVGNVVGAASYVVREDGSQVSTAQSVTRTGRTRGQTYTYTAACIDSIGREGPSASATVSIAPAASGGVFTALHYDNFEGSAIDSSKTGGDGRRWTISDDFNASVDVSVAHSTNRARVGSKSARVQLSYHNGTSWYSIGSSQYAHRNELSRRGWDTTGWNGQTTLGREYWYGWSIYLPGPNDPFGDPEWVPGSALGAHFEIVWQWHDSPDAGESTRNPPVNLKLNNPNGAGGALSRRHWVIQVLSQSVAIGGFSYDSNNAFDVGDAAADLGRWTDWVWRYKPHYTTAGILEVWKNGTKVLSRVGLPNAFNDSVGPYHKFGFYTGQRSQGAAIPSDWPQRRVAYYDQIMMGEVVGNPNTAVDSSNAGYISVAPGSW